MTPKSDGFVEVLMPRGLTPRAKRVVNEAQTLAIDRSNSYVGVEHLLLAMLDSGPSLARAALTRADVDVDRLRSELHRAMDPPAPAGGRTPQPERYDEAAAPDPEGPEGGA